MWGAYYDLLNQIIPNPRVVIMVRDLRAIYSSMEKKFRQNPDIDAKIMKNIEMTGITTDQRDEIKSQKHTTGNTGSK